MAEGALVRVGIDVGGTKILLVAADDSGHRLEEHLAATGPQFTATHLDAAVRDFLERLGLPTASIGIAVPGLINTRTGRVEVSDVLPELGGWMPDGEIGAPTFLVNDIRAALAEASATTRSPAYAAIVMAGTAIGSAFTGESGVFAGATGWAGEVGQHAGTDTGWGAAS